MEKFLIVSHIICGATVLLLGLVQMINRKGGKSHIILGKIYVGAMWWICISALSIISFYRFSAFLMVIAVLTFHSSFVGIRVMKRRTPGTEKWYDWAVGIVTGLFGLGLFGFGIYHSFFTNHEILGFLSILFGVFTSISGIKDIRFFLKKDTPIKFWWLHQHISAMGGSYIAAVTAFAVQNPNFFMPESSPQWLLWVLPGTIGGFAIGIARRKWRKKLASDTTNMSFTSSN